MTNLARSLIAMLSALLIASPALAQRSYSQPELDQMLAPVALYPDPLLSQVLMAATYPDEVAEAARWSRANPGLQGDDAVRAAQNEDWDPSVKSLVAFPQILARMAENPAWTRSLGDAFLAQEPQVMDTVQQLRRRAQAAGNLQSNEHMQVQQEGEIIMVQPASPQIVYVPYYDPYVVYGPWWWPAYQPVYWSPWPAPLRVHLSLGFFFASFDWHHRHARVAHPRAYYYRSPVYVNRNVAAAPHRWRHDPQRRAAFVQRQATQVRQPVQVQNPYRSQVQQQEPRRERRAEPRRMEQEQPRFERREVRQEPRVPAARVQPQVQPQPQAQPRVQPQPRMPAASAPAQPRAERREHRQERHESRQEHRQERHESRQEHRQERRELRQEQRRERGQKG